MCGIGGILLNRGGVDVPHDLMLERLAHRGPDVASTHLGQRLRLLHTRLSIIDLKGGNQPLFSSDGQCVLIANGEIYNYLELRTVLLAGGHRFATNSDCEAILHAYIAYGLDCLQHLEGMFAFALYDRARQRLLLARDRLGIKPLYLAETPLGWAFASEIKALRPLLSRTPTVDLHALGQYFQGQFCRGRGTLMAGVERVLPGEAVCFDLSGAEPALRRWRYWQPRCEPQFEVDDFDTIAAGFDELIMQVTEQHLRADVPYGLLLSGGVDSSLLLALMRRLGAGRPRTFSFAFEEAVDRSDALAARAVARRFDAEHSECRMPARDLLGHVAHTVWATDDLFADPANVPTSSLGRVASREVKVVLTGEGGDEVFAGYGRYRRHPIQSWGKGLGVADCGFRTRTVFDTCAARDIFGPALYDAARACRQPLLDAWQAFPAHWSRLQRMQCTDLSGELADSLLPKVDRMLMSWGVEGRVPFLDHRVVEFGLGLPDALKVRGRYGKVFLKKWGERYLESDGLWSRKRGFSVPVGRMFHDRFLTSLREALPRSGAVIAFLRPDRVRALVDRQRVRGDASGQLWPVLLLALWYRLHVEGDSGRPPSDIDPLEVLR